MTKVVLYDLPSKQGRSWSLNPWKTRMVLNFKGIDYETQWVEYPDLVPTLKALGLPPNDPNAPGYFTDYSSPAIKYDDGTMGMDSWPIAHELDKRYPTPSLRLDDPIIVKVRDLVQQVVAGLSPHLVPKASRVILNKPSTEYFEITREEIFGMPLSQFEAEKANDECWEAVMEPMQEIADLLKKHEEPFFLGKTVSYADFILVSFLHMQECIDEGVLARFLGFDTSFGKLYEASKEWLVKET